MKNIEELKQYKELLDCGIITQEEFDKKKNEFLASDSLMENHNVQSNPVAEDHNVPNDTVQKTKSLFLAGKNTKKLLVILGVIVALVIAVFGGKTIFNKIKQTNQQDKRAAALESAISSIMKQYGISKYKVKYNSSSYDYEIYAEGFDELSNGDALKCLKALDNVTTKDPCGDKTLSFSIVGDLTRVHPGMDVEYSYWRVSSVLVSWNKSNGGRYRKAGIYTDKYGWDDGPTCVYECDS